jgi:acyl-CoA thioesterase
MEPTVGTQPLDLVDPASWKPTSMDRLLQALDLSRTRTGDFRCEAAEPDWPAFPGAQLSAAVVIAAERSFPGYSVRHLSCALGPAASAQHPVELTVSGTRTGATCITARLTFAQHGAVYGEAAVLMAAETPPSPAASSVVRDMGSAPSLNAPGLVDVAIVPWDVASMRDLSMPDAESGSWRGWTRTAALGLDGTYRRALISYLAGAITVPRAASCYPGSATGPLSVTVLSQAISFLAPFDLDEGLSLSVLAPAAAEGFLHAIGEIRTASSLPAVRVSQALAVRPNLRPANNQRGQGRRRHLGLVREG